MNSVAPHTHDVPDAVKPQDMRTESVQTQGEVPVSQGKEIPVEDLFNGVVNVLGDGLEVIIDSCVSAQKHIVPHAKSGISVVYDGFHESVNDIGCFLNKKMNAIKNTPLVDDIELIRQMKKDSQDSQKSPVQG
ncbi:hypothetical protein MTBPR1_190028 [Candidatus Terasakiella magnetica]|uniref:Uncharacterized protein n=1 Tax=Candidatus Terasakiella magnetica TaxID=1867952 RepID=A0A1C3RFU5_9PROT|nr:hypothetical protein [Candidatus Terasakiella magnetica]SCA56150.1 hypothetical protein MTBPR1_190028 [Candidatus Terasakiella magnetica]